MFDEEKAFESFRPSSNFDIHPVRELEELHTKFRTLLAVSGTKFQVSLVVHCGNLQTVRSDHVEPCSKPERTSLAPNAFRVEISRPTET